MDKEFKRFPKLPHLGKGGRKKGKNVNDYDEVKNKLNLSLTPTAKNKFYSLSQKYKLPISEIFELLARSSECLKFIETQLDLKERSKEIAKRRNKTDSG